jgi:hypothetical protein
MGTTTIDAVVKATPFSPSLPTSCLLLQTQSYQPHSRKFQLTYGLQHPPAAGGHCLGGQRLAVPVDLWLHDH